MYIPRSSRISDLNRDRGAAVRVTVSKWGNSLGVRIPKGIAQDLGLIEGSVIDLRVEGGRLVAELVPSASLESLLARVTPRNLHGSLLDDDAPRGREAW